MMTSIINFFERCAPELAIATAALACFVLLGAVIFISIVFENWCAHMRDQRQRTRSQWFSHGKLAASSDGLRQVEEVSFAAERGV